MKLNEVAKEIYEISKTKGWYENGNPKMGDVISNMHSELSEAWEGYRHNNPPSEKIPDFSSIEEEFADVIIRILDTCEAEGFRLEEAMQAKINYNRNRPYKHGGKVV